MGNLSLKMQIDKSTNIILKQCMSLKPKESCLIVADTLTHKIGSALYRNSLKITKKSKLVLTNIPKSHGAEPPKEIAREMLKYDVVLMPTTKSLSHTRARENASRKGARIASMPGITIGMMKRTLNIDFNKLITINKKLIGKLKNSNKIIITTAKGTNMEFYTKGRKWTGDDGIYAKKGAFRNLPAGEIFTAPLENKSNGIIMADASVGGLGKVDKNIEIKVRNGFIQSIEGGKIAGQFSKLLKNRLYKNVAELG